MKPYIKLIETTWLPETFKKGWGNGYVILPKDHPFYGVHYDEINSFVEVHGGLTYSDYEENGHNGWCVGFDTNHLGDTIKEWPYEAVKDQTIKLLNQFIELGNKYTKEQYKELL